MPNPERPESLIAAVIAPESNDPSITSVRTRLESSGLAVRDIEPEEPSSPKRLWQLDATLAGVDGAGDLRCRVIAMRHEPAILKPALAPRLLSGPLGDRARAARVQIGVEVTFADKPLRDYHRQLKLLRACAPDAILVLDVPAYSVRSAHWLRDVTSVHVPPAATHLFTIHAVGDGAPNAPTWMHTHGLSRCGSIEIEVLNVPSQSNRLMGDLLNAVATSFIDEGVPPPRERFLGGAGLELVWLPWREALDELGRVGPGGLEDRRDGHNDERGVLLAPRKGWFGTKYESPTCYLPRLEQNPVLYISPLETTRMSLLARERFDRFAALHREHGSAETWKFLIKIGLTTDHAKNPNDREHLWFEVHRVEGGQIDATLLNEPYDVARLHEGQRGRFPIAQTTDWMILSREHGRITPDTLFRLDEAMNGFET